MVDAADAPELALEPAGNDPPKPGGDAPPKPSNTPSDAPADELAPKQGETLEAYSARIKNEVSWRDRQLTQQHKRIKERDEKLTRAQELEQENERLRGLAEAAAKRQKATPEPQPEPARRAAEPQPGPDANTMAEARFTVRLEAMADDLQKSRNAEFRAATAKFQQAGGIQRPVMEAILDTDDPAHVFLELSKDMNRFQDIMEMPEGRRRAALIKMGMETQKSPEPARKADKPSDAPAPRGGLPSGSAAPAEGEFNPDDDCRVPLDRRATDPGKYVGEEHDAAWYAKRQAEKAASKGRPWSRGK